MTRLFPKIVAVFCLGSGLFRAYGADDRLTYLPDTLYQVDQLIPSGSRAEAEDNSVTSYGCKLSTTYPGYSGSGYIEMGGQGSWMSWDKIDGGPGGTCTLSIRFSNGSSGARQCVIKVNGVVVQTLGFMPTGSWSTWKNAIDVKATLKSGINSVRIEANTASGGPCIDSMKVTAANPPGSPNAQYSYSKNDKLVQFSDQSTVPSGGISSWHWDFGDGTTSNQQNPSHSYPNYGMYHVSLMITDNAGNTNTRHQSVDVRNTNASNRYCNSYSRHNMYEAIGQIQIGSYSHASGVSSYSDFTSEAINLSNGSSYSVTLTPKFLQGAYVEYWSIWADLNGNGNFNDPGEQLFTAVGNGPVTGTFTLPSTANTTTRMRISMKCNADPTACEVFDGGEVEDYTISIAAPSNPLVANFTYSVNNQTATFTDSSMAGSDGWINSYAWEFGDNTFSNEKNPSHTYSMGGTYSVRLTVSDNNGNRKSTTQPVVITSAPVLTPDFTFTVNNQTAVFTNNSTITSGGVINSYSWEFGDNTYSNEKNPPSHTYTTSGNFSVRLTVSDNNGNRKSITKQVEIKPATTITPNFTFSASNQTVLFTDSSTISGGSITNWYWQFGDGTTTNQQSPSHTYSQGGSYSVQLTVTDNTGRSNSITKQVVISGGSGGDAGKYCSSYGKQSSQDWIGKVQIGDFFNTSGANSYSDFTSKVINVQRGKTYPFIITQGNGSLANVQYGSVWIDLYQEGNFSNPNDINLMFYGNKEMTSSLTIMPNAKLGLTRMRITMKRGSFPSSPCEAFEYGEVEDYTVNITDEYVSNGPSPDFNININNQTVCFNDSSAVTSGSITSWYWEFGDGQTSNQQNPSHLYSGSNTYNVKLTVTDNYGRTNSKSKQVVVGTSQNNVALGKPTSQSSTYGAYTASLAVDGKTDGNIGSGSLSHTNSDFHAWWQVNLGAPHDITKVTLWNRTDSYGDRLSNFHVDYLDANDNVIATQPYAGVAGVMTDCNLSASRVYSVRVQLNGTNFLSLAEVQVFGTASSTSNLQANFTFTTNNQTATFTNSSTVSSGTITGWSWQFGDGQTSNEKNPSHTYSSNGAYNVQLTVTDNNGRTNSNLKQVIISTGSSLDFTYTTNGQTVNVDAPGQINGVGISTWFWQFSDGSTANQKTCGHTFSTVGNYTIQLTVADTNGFTYSISKQVTISGASSSLDFTYTMNNGYQTITFSAPDQVNSVMISNWSWQFGDGNTSTEQNPSHFYSNGGAYNVLLTVKDSNGKTYSVPKQVAGSSAFQANFTYYSLNQTTFFADCSPSLGSTITSWSWEFGDGTTSIEKKPSHNYSSYGTYNVKLTIKDNYGRISSYTKQVSYYSSPSYCISTSKSCSFVGIGYVNINSFQNTSDRTTYSDFTSQVIDVSRGNNSSYVIKPRFYNTVSDYFCSVWIDFNGNGDFDDPGEQVIATSGSGSYGINGSIPIPASVKTGSTRMRVSLKMYANPAVSSCDNFEQGEVEDYTVNIQ